MNGELYGLVAEFGDPEDLKAAATRAYVSGYRCLDAYAPYPVDGLSECLGFHHDGVRWLTLAGGLGGASFGFGLQYYASVVAYPINVGGRPLFSWPAYIPVIFECTVLFAALTAVFGMFVLNRLPRPYHSIFNAKNFQFATRSRFFLCIEACDAKFELEETRSFLSAAPALEVVEVEK